MERRCWDLHVETTHPRGRVLRAFLLINWFLLKRGPFLGLAVSPRHSVTCSHRPFIFRLQPNHEDVPPPFSRGGDRYLNTLGYIAGRYHEVGICILSPLSMVAITGYRPPKPIEPFRRLHRSVPSSPGPVVTAVHRPRLMPHMLG